MDRASSSPEDIFQDADFFYESAAAHLDRNRGHEQTFRFGATTPQNSPIQRSLDEQMSYKLSNFSLSSSPQYYSTSPAPGYLENEMQMKKDDRGF